MFDVSHGAFLPVPLEHRAKTSIVAWFRELENRGRERPFVYFAQLARREEAKKKYVGQTTCTGETETWKSLMSKCRRN